MRLLLGFLLFGIWASIARYYYVCEIKNHCGLKTEVVENPLPVREQTLSLALGDSVILEGYNQFYFKEKISKPTLDSSNNIFLEKITEFMLDNPDTKLKITGRFLESEKGPFQMMDNIGIARAAAIEQELISLGIPEDRISFDHALPVEGELLSNPVSFEILNSDDTELEDVQFTFNNMTFTEANFKFDSDVFEPQESFVMYADSLKTYFEINPDKSLKIIGHTDKVGKQKYNKDLGFRRANSAKDYLVNKVGIEIEIGIESEGEKKPMASNKTAEGQSRNRRVNLVIE